MSATSNAPRPNGTGTERPAFHRRNKSASVLKSIIAPSKASQLLRTTSDEPRTPSSPLKENANPRLRSTTTKVPLLPADHLHAGGTTPGLRPSSDQSSPCKKTSRSAEGPTPSRGLHKKTKSIVSLRSLGRSSEDNYREAAEADETTSATRHRPKKAKSSTNLANVFASFKTPKHKGRDEPEVENKENAAPMRTPVEPSRTPIWEQFNTQSFVPPTMAQTTRVPLNDALAATQKEMSLYTPRDYSPSKQRNFFGDDQPVLARKSKERPRSDGLTLSKTSSNLVAALSRKFSEEDKTKGHKAGEGASQSRSLHRNEEQRPQEISQVGSGASTGASAAMIGKGGSKVMAAVTMFNGRSKDAYTATATPDDIEADFEAVLDAQNIPENIRQKMRSLKSNLKADFIRLHKLEHTTKTKGTDSEFEIHDETHPNGLTAEDEAEIANNVPSADAEQGSPGKRSRPRSKTFTFSKGNPSPTKKHKGDVYQNAQNAPSSTMLPRTGPSSNAITKLTNSLQGGKSSKAAAPEEFVSYLRQVRKPELVEVGKLHKLRLLLRNETVNWVDTFMKMGGMTEIVGLLHQIMQVEWREEHEDALLHETLLCLKALCTTSLAIQKLRSIESTLFPALLAMLFDKEHKGPAEFTTRKIIIDLLFTLVTAAAKDPATLPARAKTILGYLQDPQPAEERRPLGFITEMHQSRPYKLWCKEIVDVTKEVFWIFLHHMNVVPLAPSQPPSRPTTSSSTTSSGIGEEATAAAVTGRNKGAETPGRTPKPKPQRLDLDAADYLSRFYPQPRPPVPAAPYVGGVEWDATHYLASHLDLLNSLIASLPTPAERNSLRTELRLSGLEKAMGSTLRTCKEKFYSAVHDGLRTWVAAAAADGWDVNDVRFGPGRCEDKVAGSVAVATPASSSPVKKVASPKKKNGASADEAAPRIGNLPGLGDLGLGLSGVATGERGGAGAGDDWLL